MDSSDAAISKSLLHWLNAWEQCLELWLECGAATPSPQALRLLRDWSKMSATGGWHEVHALAAVLLDTRSTAARKADALLDLLSWQLCTQRIFDARALQDE